MEGGLVVATYTHDEVIDLVRTWLHEDVSSERVLEPEDKQMLSVIDDLFNEHYTKEHIQLLEEKADSLWQEHEQHIANQIWGSATMIARVTAGVRTAISVIGRKSSE